MPSRAGRSKGRLVEDVVDDAMRSIDDDRAHLFDFYQYCRRKAPGYFDKMNIEEFQAWNDSRIAQVVGSGGEPQERSGTMMLGNKLLLILLQEVGGVPDPTLKRLVMLKNALVEDYEKAPSDTASRLIYEELKAHAISNGVLAAGELTPAAQREIDAIRKRCGKDRTH